MRRRAVLFKLIYRTMESWVVTRDSPEAKFKIQ